MPSDEKVEADQPEKEKTITDDLRVESFNNFQTTDDHLMHIQVWQQIRQEQNSG